MSRFSDVATLQKIIVSMDNAGQAIESVIETDVFCNVYKQGTATWIAAQNAGLHADAEIQLRECDYNGQQRVIFKGQAYEVEVAKIGGEFIRLVLKERANV